jgi:outer membrane protein assembly factor BamB
LPAALLLTLFSVSVARGEVLWSMKSGKEIKWHHVTALGSVVVGTDAAVTCYDGESGQVNWQRQELKKISEFEVAEIPGTPVLLVGDEESSKSTLDAVDILTGESIWESDKIKGGGDWHRTDLCKEHGAGAN